jgi:hypothetical protein
MGGDFLHQKKEYNSIKNIHSLPVLGGGEFDL